MGGMKRFAAAAAAVAMMGASVVMATAAGSAQFAGNNGRIQYSKVAGGQQQISASVHLVNPDGTGDVTVVADGWWASQDAAATKLSYVDSAGTTLYVSNFDGTGATAIHTAANIAATSMAPDGTKVAFIDRSAPTDLYVINVDGSGLTNLTNGGVPNPNWPQFSPDGSTIMFIANPGTPGSSQIQTVPVTGGSITTIATGYYVWPSWTPDGTILAVAEVNGVASIVRMNADGSGQTTLLTAASIGAVTLYWPVASPDGTKFSFSVGTSAPGPNGDPLSLWTANIDGSGATKILETTDGSDAALAIWSSNGGVPATTTTTTTVVPDEPVTPKHTG